MNEPGKWVRDYTFELFQEAQWSFGGENTRNRLGAEFQGRNNSLWRAGMEFNYEFPHFDTRELRGGPALMNDDLVMAELSITTNTARDLYAGMGYQHTYFGVPSSRMDNFEASITWLPIKRLTLSGLANLNQRKFHQQYVSTLSGSPDDEYVVGWIDQSTASLTFRGELFLNPELSIQYYGSPYYSVGKYKDFKRVNEPAEKDIGQRLESLDLTYDAENRTYSYTHDSRNFTFGDPDFSFMQFRSNLVFRWEYKLGSTVYLVWSHDRFNWIPSYNPIREISGDLFGIKGNHVFMIKLNYWFSL
jgi:hypothetical protein